VDAAPGVKLDDLMASFVDGAGDFFRRKLKGLRGSLARAAAAAADIGRYAIRRALGRDPEPFELLEEALDRILAAASNRLNEAKKPTILCIAESKRLAKEAESQAAYAAEWAERAEAAMAAGDIELSHEARARALEHEALLEHLQREQRKMEDLANQCKHELRDLHHAIEDAKRARTRAHAARSVATGESDLRPLR
jgi:phage shock protein A